MFGGGGEEEEEEEEEEDAFASQALLTEFVNQEYERQQQVELYNETRNKTLQ